MARLLSPRLIAITDVSRLSAETLLHRARALVEAAAPGSVALLLRDHALPARERLRLGRELRRITLEGEQQLWVADRLDLLLALEADGAHLGEGSVAAADARRLLGGAGRISRAWHVAGVTPQNVPELECVDALLLSPIVEARKGRTALGVAAVVELRQALTARPHRPEVYALGGVTAASAAACVAAGARGVAAIGAAWQPDVVELIDALGVRR